MVISWYASSHGFEYAIGTVGALSVRPQQQNLHHVAGIGGTTSLYWTSGISGIVVGTKKGGIYWSSIDQIQNGNANKWKMDADGNILVGWSELESNEYKTKYPIYSMELVSSSFGNEFLFCGSGDRWISVWKLARNGEIYSNCEFVLKLGPHTGWVKDLVYDEMNQLLHSIGCNCVETWDCTSLDQTQRTETLISHITKRAIENSPTMGTTLSSDLLCLCLLPPQNTLPRLLVTGGVDGRIHSWLSDPRKTISNNLDGKNPIHTVLAHDGRVNKIVYSSATDILFTVGNDGSLCAFRASIGNGFEMVSRLKIDESKSSLRITVATIMNESEQQGTCTLALGSSTGELYFVFAQINPDGGIGCSVQRECSTMAENPMIYSLSSQKGSDLSRLWIGHASGLATMDRSL